jgi:hypothetical protein
LTLFEFCGSQRSRFCCCKNYLTYDIIFVQLKALPFGEASDILATRDPDAEEEDEETPIFEKHDPMLYGPRKSKKDRFISIAFMKKYIHVAKAIKVQFL